jgi:hypothetical protein
MTSSKKKNKLVVVVDAEVQTDDEPAASLSSSCMVHPLCRVENALFAKHDEASPPQLLFKEVSPLDLKTLSEADHKRMQDGIAQAVTGDGDARWIQLFVGLLLRGVDLMEHAVVEDDKAQQWLHQVSLAVVQGKTASQQTLGGDVSIPVWALAVMSVVVVVLVVLMLTFFGVVLQELLNKRKFNNIDVITI